MSDVVRQMRLLSLSSWGGVDLQSTGRTDVRPQPPTPLEACSRPRRKLRRIFYIPYLLAILAGGYLICRLVPADLKEAIRDTYFNPDAVVDPPASEGGSQP